MAWRLDAASSILKTRYSYDKDSKQAWSSIRENAAFQLKETADNRLRMSHSYISMEFNITDEEIIKLPDVGSTDSEINCENDGIDLIFWRRS